MTQHFPWPQYRRPWSLDVEVLGVTPAGEPDVDPDRRRIRLDELEDWTQVGLRLRLATTERTPDGVAQMSPYVMVSAARSNLRLPVLLEQDGDTFVGDCHLMRSSLAGITELQAYVASVGGSAVGDEPTPTRIIGESEPWTVVVDPGESPPAPGAPPFETERRHFSDPGSPPQLRAAATSYALMDMSGPDPVLYLNQDIIGLEHILDAKSPKLEKRRLRDLLGAQIAHHVLSTLFREALDRTVVEDDLVTIPEDRLMKQVCEAVSEAVPSVEGSEDMMRRLLDSSTDRARVWMEVENALTVLTGVGDAVARSVKEVHLA